MATIPKYISIITLVIVAVIGTVAIFAYIDDSQIKVVRELPECNNEPKPPVPDVEGIAWNIDECYYFLHNPSIPYGFQIPDICTKDMIKHLAKYSSMFSNDEHFMLNFVGLPDGTNLEHFEQCKNQLLEIRNKNFEDESVSKLNTQISVKEELLEIESRHCSVFPKYDYNKGEYLTRENESIAKQKLDDCYKQIEDEKDLLRSWTCQELSEKSKNGFDELEWSNDGLAAQRHLQYCINSEKHRANVGTCQSLSERYRTGEPYLNISNKLLTEQKLQDICHYDLEEKFGKIYEDDFEIDYTEKFD
jgi:hypothetical protein